MKPALLFALGQNSYYSFGMQMAGSYTPTNPNKKLYNAGSEWQDDIDGLADYYSTFYREYDPVIGRFNGVDPMAEATDNMTTYGYANNNPIMMNDPLGDLPSGSTNEMAQQMQAEYRAWHDAKYGEWNDWSRFTAAWGFDFSGGGNGGGTEFNFYSTYAGMKVRLNNFGKDGIKYGTDKKTGAFGYWQSFVGDDYDEGSNAMTGVTVGSRFIILPSFATLLANYPLPYSHRPDRTPSNRKIPVDDADGSTFRYFNQCAIRMSVCLRNSGVNIVGAKNTTNPGGQTYANGNIIGAQNLAVHLKSIFGEPTAYNGTKEDIYTLLSGKTGIIFFQNFAESNPDGTTFTSWGNTHIDLWNSGTIMMNEQYSTPDKASRIWFWEIK